MLWLRTFSSSVDFSAGSFDRRPLDDFLSRLRPEVKRLVSSSKGLVGVLDREPLGADPYVFTEALTILPPSCDTGLVVE